MNILVVDDETIIREWLQYTIESFTFHDFSVDIAHDGLDAMEKTEQKKYDLIFIDIQMPRMNGLEFIENLHKNHSQTLSIVLSSHNNFDYAREALRKGAFEYVLKSECNKEYLAELLKRCVQQNIIKGTNTNDIYHQFLQDILHKSTNENALANNYESLLSELMGSKYACIVCQSPPNEGIFTIEYSFLKTYSIIDLGLMDSLHFFIISFPSTCELEYNKIHLNTIFEAICEQHPDSLISCSSFYSTPEQVSESIQNAIGALEYNFYMKQNYIFDTKYQFTDSLDEFNNLYTKILHNIKHYNNHEIFQYVNELNQWIEYYTPHVAIVKNTYDNILHSIYLYHYDDANELPQYIASIQDMIHSSIHYHVLKENVITTIRQCVLSLSQSKTYSIHIESALAYIADNYAEINSVSSIAEYVHLNSDYLTRLFRKETGKNISSYLMEYKLKIAANMLRTSHMQISDVASRVGIDNLSYFSKKFKEQFYVSPVCYRDQKLSNEEHSF